MHDSLAEALEKEGDLESAKKSYGRAWELGEAAKDRNTALFKANFERVTAKLAARPVGLSR